MSVLSFLWVLQRVDSCVHPCMNHHLLINVHSHFCFAQPLTLDDVQIEQLPSGNAFHSTSTMTAKVRNKTVYREVESTTNSARSDNDKQLLPLLTHSREQQDPWTTTRSYRVLPFTDPVINASMPRSSGMLRCEWDQFKTTYSVSAHYRLPQLFGRRAVNIDFALHQLAVYWTSISLRSGTISVSNLGTCKSSIWRACVTGDEATVRALTINGKASPYDCFDECMCDRLWRPCHCPCQFESGDTVLPVGI